jgi:hypothetical protein
VQDVENAERWGQVLTALRPMLGADVVRDWVAPCRCVGMGAGGVWLLAPSEVVRQWWDSRLGGRAAVRAAVATVLGLGGRVPELYVRLAAESTKSQAPNSNGAGGSFQRVDGVGVAARINGRRAAR